VIDRRHGDHDQPRDELRRLGLFVVAGASARGKSKRGGGGALSSPVKEERS
jgi:hypothetical protein